MLSLHTCTCGIGINVELARMNKLQNMAIYLGFVSVCTLALCELIRYMHAPSQYCYTFHGMNLHETANFCV